MTNDSLNDLIAKNLLARGYKKYPPHMMDNYSCMYQRKISDGTGCLYYINVREWVHVGVHTFDAQLCCDSDSNGYAWITIKEDTIDAIEKRIAKLWEACGSKRYDD